MRVQAAVTVATVEGSSIMRKMTLIAASALALSVVMTSVSAQTTPEVTVSGSRTVKTEQMTPGSAPIVHASLSYTVSAVGLDLASQNGKTQLQKRVSDAARKACSELQHQFPGTTPSVDECTRQAKATAMVKVNEIEAAASKGK